MPSLIISEQIVPQCFVVNDFSNASYPTDSLFVLHQQGRSKFLDISGGENLDDLALRVKIGQNDDPLLLDPSKKACCIVRYCEGWSKNSPKERLST